MCLIISIQAAAHTGTGTGTGTGDCRGRSPPPRCHPLLRSKFSHIHKPSHTSLTPRATSHTTHLHSAFPFPLPIHSPAPPSLSPPSLHLFCILHRARGAWHPHAHKSSNLETLTQAQSCLARLIICPPSSHTYLAGNLAIHPVPLTRRPQLNSSPALPPTRAVDSLASFGHQGRNPVLPSGASPSHTSHPGSRNSHTSSISSATDTLPMEHTAATVAFSAPAGVGSGAPLH